MVLKSRKKSTKIGFIAALIILAAGCFAGFAYNEFFSGKSRAVAEENITYMAMESAEIGWDSSSSMRKSAGNAQIYANGAYIESLSKPVMTVLQFPQVAEVHFNTTIRKQYTQGSAELYFRIVHEHANSGLNEVIYPAGGGWLYLNGQLNQDGTAFDPVSITDYVNVQAGDKLKLIVENRNSGSYCTAVLGGGFSFIFEGGTAGGLSVNYTDGAVSYATTDTKNTAISNSLKAYYGADAVKSDVLTYEYIKSCSDHNDGNYVDADTFDYYNVKTLQTDIGTVQGSSFSARTQYFVWGADLAGAEYIALDVENGLGDTVKVGADILINDVNFYGAVWTTGVYTTYYLKDVSGNITKGLLTSGEFNRGETEIPAGFDGMVIFPVENLERIGYRYGAELNGSTGDFKTIDLDNVLRFDAVVAPALNASYNASGTFKVKALKVLGTNLAEISFNADGVIRAIKNIGTVNYASENVIAEARRQYDLLSAAQKTQVNNYDVLLSTEQRFAALTEFVGYVGTHGKDFSESEGVIFDKPFNSSPATVAAWIKVAHDIADDVHIGTVVGNLGKSTVGQGLYDSEHSFSMEITVNGNPRFVWRISDTEKAAFVVKNADVRTGKWLHLAFVRDSRSGFIGCYINGMLAAGCYTEPMFISDISMYTPAMIGSDYTDDFTLSIGENPKFKGKIANVRVYSEMLTLDGIAADLKGVKGAGILGCVDFLSGESGTYYGAAGIGAKDAYGWKDVAAGDFDVEDGFTVAVFGDTQMLLAKAKDDSGKDLYDADYDYTSNVLYKNVQWLIENKNRLNLQFVMHLGDMTDNLNNAYASTKGVKELQYGLQFMDMLTAANVKWSLCRGEHDGGFNATNIGYYNSEYSYAKYASYAAGTYNQTDMHTAYYTFEVGGQKYLIMVLDVEPTNAEINWANTIISANPDRRVIITTHAYMGYTGGLLSSKMSASGNSGEDIWTKCASKYKNVVMVLCGHADGVNIVKSTLTGENGNTVYQIMTDTTKADYYGSKQTGVFALLNFASDGNRVNFTYYSALENKLFRSHNQFSIDLSPDEYGFDVYTKDGLDVAVLPDISGFVDANGRTDQWGGMYAVEGGGSGLGMNSNNFGINDSTYAYAAAFDIESKGLFRFDDTAYVKTNATSWFYVSAYVIDGSGFAKRWFPKNSSITVPSASATQGLTVREKSIDYVIRGDQQTFYLENIGGLYVDSGDKIVVLMQSFGVNYAKFEATLYNIDGTETKFSTEGAFNTASSASSAVITELYNAGYGQVNVDGTPKNYNGITVGWFRTAENNGSYAPFKYSVDIEDASGDTIISAIGAVNSTFVLPELFISGHTFIGYNFGGDIYPAGYSLTVNGDISLIAVFIEFAMINGASVRTVRPEGLRFTSHIVKEDYDYLIDNGLTVDMGTIIVKASDIASGGAYDYGKVALDTEITNVNVVSTVQYFATGKLVFNAALVGITAKNYGEQFAARSYITITYACGTQKTYYASLENNARSIREIALSALADTSAVYSSYYCYSYNGVYVRFDSGALQLLQEFIEGE